MKPEHERLNKYIDDLQAGQHPGVEPARDPEELELFQVAAEWNALRAGADEPDQVFVAQLRGGLENMAPSSRHRDGSSRARVAPVSATEQPQPPQRAPAGVAGSAAAGAEAVEGGHGAAPPARQWPFNRRQFLGALGGAAAGLVAGLGLDRLFNDDVRAYAQPAGQMSPSQGKWFAVARADQVKPGEGVPFSAGAVKGILLHREDGFVALSRICTHLGCEVGWLASAQILACGCHGSSFDPSGRPRTGPAIYKEPIRSLPSFQIKIDGGVVYVLA